MKKIKIQPEQDIDGTLPYPYFIDEKGLVGRQDFWKGNPFQLLGFSIKPKAGEIDLPLQEFLEEPKEAIGKYPVFTDDKKNWFTKTNVIESVSINGNKYSLEKDHKAIKKQIKGWEKTLDKIVKDFYGGQLMAPKTVAQALEAMSHEMMAINI